MSNYKMIESKAFWREITQPRVKNFLKSLAEPKLRVHKRILYTLSEFIDGFRNLSNFTQSYKLE